MRTLLVIVGAAMLLWSCAGRRSWPFVTVLPAGSTQIDIVQGPKKPKIPGDPPRLVVTAGDPVSWRLVNEAHDDVEITLRNFRLGGVGSDRSADIFVDVPPQGRVLKSGVTRMHARLRRDAPAGIYTYAIHPDPGDPHNSPEIEIRPPGR